MNYYWRKKFGWSKSRQEIWQSCKKAYYYRYIGKWEKEKKEKLMFLNSLNTIPQIRGGYIHDAIRQQVLQHKAGRNISLISAQNYFKMRFNQVIENPKSFLVEAVNGIEIDIEELKEILNEANRLLENFFNILWHNYKNLKYLSHETLEKFYIKGIPIWVQPDMVTVNPDGMIMISDWKTGKNEEDPNENIQLGIYTLWAKEKYNCESNKIKAELVYLDSCNSLVTERNKIQLEELENYIVKNAQDMLSVENENDFPANPTPSKCRVCNFATICSESSVEK
jgi:CRISPR/Cas system-associated exonuclease Cas4 (RecB family)